MYLVTSKIIVLFFTVPLFVGCTSTSPDISAQTSLSDTNVTTAGCNKPMTFIESSENTVSEDGFTILYDEKGKETLSTLIQKALENQKKAGC